MVRSEEFGESRRPAFDWHREAIDEVVDTVLGLDDIRPDDQLLALVLANLGLETLDSQQVAAGRIRAGLGDLEAVLVKLDNSIQVLKPSVERHQLVIILGHFWRPVGSRNSSAGQRPRGIVLGCRIPGIPELPVDVQLPGEVDTPDEISSSDWERTSLGQTCCLFKPAPSSVKRSNLFSPAPVPRGDEGKGTHLIAPEPRSGRSGCLHSGSSAPDCWPVPGRIKLLERLINLKLFDPELN